MRLSIKKHNMQTLTATHIDSVKSSYGRCLAKGDFLGRFYDIFLGSHPDIAPHFKNTDFTRQKELIRHGISCVIMYSSGQFTGQSCLTRIRKSHSKNELNIDPKYYGYWEASLLQTIKEFDRELTPETEEGWKEVITIATDYIKSGY